MKRIYFKIIIIAALLSLACTTKVSEWVLLNSVPYTYLFIYFHKNEISETIKNQLINDKVWEEPIVTEIVEMDKFYAAEDYHHNYFENNPQNMYCQSVVRPKVEKFKKVFSNIMK